MVLSVYEEATVYCGNRAPLTPLQAQFSLSFGVAAMMKWGRLDPWVYKEPQFSNEQVKSLEALLKVEVNPVWTQQLTRAAHLTVDLKDGTQLSKTILAVPGDLQIPFTKEALVAKFVDYCHGSLSIEQANAWATELLDVNLNHQPFQFWQ